MSLEISISSWFAIGQSDSDTGFFTALTSLFKDIATAVEENRDLLVNGFGGSFFVDFTLGLQQECDVQVSAPPVVCLNASCAALTVAHAACADTYADTADTAC